MVGSDKGTVLLFPFHLVGTWHLILDSTNNLSILEMIERFVIMHGKIIFSQRGYSESIQMQINNRFDYERTDDLW